MFRFSGNYMVDGSILQIDCNRNAFHPIDITDAANEQVFLMNQGKVLSSKDIYFE